LSIRAQRKIKSIEITLSQNVQNILAKPETSYDDLLDALRLALKGYIIN
jgi:hypothetical protein